MRRRARVLAVTLAPMLICGVGAIAQDAPVRVRGAIVKVDGNTLAVIARNGAPVTVRLLDNAKIVAIVKASLADIKPGSFIGTTATPQSDGSLRAVEVHIFPETMRGTGEGHRAWDLGPSSTMTNGTVAQAVDKVEGNALTIRYKEGEKTVLVTPETVIVTYTIADRGELKPDAKIFISSAIKKPDGSLEAERVNVGRDGLTPPM